MFMCILGLIFVFIWGWFKDWFIGVIIFGCDSIWGLLLIELILILFFCWLFCIKAFTSSAETCCIFVGLKEKLFGLNLLFCSFKLFNWKALLLIVFALILLFNILLLIFFWLLFSLIFVLILFFTCLLLINLFSAFLALLLFFVSICFFFLLLSFFEILLLFLLLFTFMLLFPANSFIWFIERFISSSICSIISLCAFKSSNSILLLLLLLLLILISFLLLSLFSSKFFSSFSKESSSLITLLISFSPEPKSIGFIWLIILSLNKFGFFLLILIRLLLSKLYVPKDILSYWFNISFLFVNSDVFTENSFNGLLGLRFAFKLL